MDKTTAMYKTLLVEFPDASDHMTAKQDELMAEWSSLLAKARLRSERLQEAESVQLYFDDYRGLWSELLQLCMHTHTNQFTWFRDFLRNRQKS